MSEDKEIKAMKEIADALSTLDEKAVRRVLQWATSRFLDSNSEEVTSAASLGEKSSVDESATLAEFETVADLFAKAAPKNDSDKALVVGYWLQYCEGNSEFRSRQVNQHLKDLGYRVSNITKALGRLTQCKPQLVVQTKKSGTSKQAQKKYKLTDAGKSAVERMLKQNE